MTEWQSFGEPVELSGYAHLPARLPSEVLASWIQPYRSLEKLITPSQTLWDKWFLTEFEPPSHYSEIEGVYFQCRRELEIALWKIKDMYLECAWDITSREQEMFDRNAFIKTRQEYMNNVIEPLEAQHDEIRRALQERQRHAFMEQQAERKIEEL